MGRRGTLEYIKTINLKNVANIAVYQYENYEIRIEKAPDSPIIINGHHIKDSDGLFFPIFTISNETMTIHSFNMVIRLTKLEELIEALQDLQAINGLIPKLMDLAKQIPNVE